MLSSLITGRIVWAEIADANGVRKLRPVIIVTPTAQIKSTHPFDVIAVTSWLPKVIPDDHVVLPWHADGHPRTGLNRRCAAVCTWLSQITDADIVAVAGIVPTPLMNIILDKIAGAIISTAAKPKGIGDFQLSET